MGEEHSRHEDSMFKDGLGETVGSALHSPK